MTLDDRRWRFGPSGIVHACGYHVRRSAVMRRVSRVAAVRSVP
jgi:hypothetical protein